MQFTVDTHTHTTASGHAYSTLHDYVARAREVGIKLFAMTDHAPQMPGAPHYWHFGNLRVIPRVLDGIGILRGVEANILNEEGEIDLFGDILAQMDIVIGSFHEPVFKPADVASHTRAMINAIKSGRIDIVGHSGNPNFPIDIPAVVQAAAEHRVLIEINNSSFVHSRIGSADNCLAIAAAARDLGAWLTFGSDSHIACTLGQFNHCQEAIRRVGFPLERVVSREPAALLDFLEQRGKSLKHEFAAIV